MIPPPQPPPRGDLPVESAATAKLDLVDWRCSVADLYAALRGERSPRAAHAIWRAERDRLFREHPQSPLPEGDRLRDTGLPYWPYDPTLRFELPLIPATAERRISVASDADGAMLLRSVGRIELPAPLSSPIDVWWLEQYGGGLFIPIRDATAGAATYGGGRYLLDTAKGAYLGARENRLVIDLNFLYHPSCRYDSAWQCPLAPPENTLSVAIRAGETL